jgi:hypothetical protein
MERYKRGALVNTSWRTWNRMSPFAYWSGAQTLGLAGVVVGHADETKHFKAATWPASTNEAGVMSS